MSLTALKTSPGLSKANLEDYQHRGVEFLHNTDFAALWVDCGLGKTAITLTGIAELWSARMVSKILVVSTKKVVEETWPTEIKDWSNLFPIQPRFSLITGTPKQRTKAADSDADIYATNVENFTWLVKNYGKTWPWDWIVMDESSLFKDHSTGRFKAFKKIRHKVDRITQLTGTPASKGLLHLWAQVYLLDQGERLGRTVTAYRRKYFDAFNRGQYTEYVLKEGAEQEIHDKVRDLVFRLDGDDYLKMEPVRKVYHRMEMTSESSETYKQLARDLILEMEQDQVVVAANNAVLSNKLWQCANGAVYLSETENREWKHIHDLKLDKLEQIVEETAAPVLVAYNFQHDLERLRGRFPNAVNVKEPGAIERWNKGEIDILLAHPKSAGHGLNLQHGGNVLVWFSLHWSLELYIQFIARLRRKGQKKPVICHHLVVEGTVDEQILLTLDGHNVTQTELLNAMKEQVAA